MLLLVAFSLLLISLGGRDLAAERPRADRSLTINQVVDAYKQASSLPDVISFNETASYKMAELAAPTTNSGSRYLPPPMTHFASVARDRERMKAQVHTKWSFTGKETAVPADDSHEFLVSRVAVGGVPGEYFLDHIVWKNTVIPDQIFATTDTKAAWIRLPAMILDGFLPGFDGKDFADLLRESTARKITVEQDKLDGHAIYLIRASTPYGQCSLWIDPAKHFQPERIELHKTSKDWIAPQMPLSMRKIERMDFIADDSRVEEIGDHCLVTHLRTSARLKYNSGRVLQTDGAFDRTDINLNPVFPKGTFSIAAANGTRVSITGDASGTKYEWQDNSIVPVLEDPFQALLQKQAPSRAQSFTSPSTGAVTRPAAASP